MKNKIPEFLKENFNKQTARPKFFPDDMKQFILDYGKCYNYTNTENLEGNQLLSLWFRYMKSGINEIGICGYKNCNNQNRIVNDSKTNRFKVSEGCCSEHSFKISMLENHGVENAMHLESSKEKIKETCLKNLGVENPMKSELVRNKLSKTMMENYGTDNIFKNADLIKTKFKEKYGVENPSQIPEIMSKKKSKSFSKKEFNWKTGEISIVQGYEDQVLFDLENKGYKFEDIITDEKDVPEIFYEFEGKRRRYYPDIFIPKENLIIEVKSDYTLNKEWEKNQVKFDATKNLGFNFKLEVR